MKISSSIHKKIKGLIGICLVFFSLVSPTLFAQKLSLRNIDIPDTVIRGSQVTFRFSVLNDGTKSQLGNLRIWFSNLNLNNIAAPLGFLNANQYFAPQQKRDFEITLPVSPELFIGGGNTVVIWPSFINIPSVISDSVTLEIFVIEPNSIDSKYNNSENSLQAIPNPVGEKIILNFADKIQEFSGMNLRDLSGRIIQSSAESWMDMSTIHSGIYLLEIRTKKGVSYTRKIIRE